MHRYDHPGFKIQYRTSYFCVFCVCRDDIWCFNLVLVMELGDTQRYRIQGTHQGRIMLNTSVKTMAIETTVTCTRSKMESELYIFRSKVAAGDTLRV